MHTIDAGFVATGFAGRALADVESIGQSPACAHRSRVLDSIGPFGRPYPLIDRPERVARTTVRPC